MKHNIWQSVY